MMITVISGYCAIRVGRHWIGATQHGFCDKRRMTKAAALRDAMLSASPAKKTRVEGYHERRGAR